MSTAYICLGGNHDDTRRHIQGAAHFLATLGVIRQSSGIFRSEAEWCPPGTPLYLNEVIILDTDLEPRQLHCRIKAYETAIRHLNPGERVIIDIDTVELDGAILRPRDHNSAHYHKGLELLKSN